MRILAAIAEDLVELAAVSAFLLALVGWLAGAAGHF
jgi:hypothetical protein